MKAQTLQSSIIWRNLAFLFILNIFLFIFIFKKLVASFLNLKMQTEINIDYKLIKKMSNLAIKNIILLKGELELTKIEKEANNFKIRFLYEISPQSFQKHFTNMPLFNQTRKKK